MSDPSSAPSATAPRIGSSRVDHKHVGLLYVISSLLFFLVGGMEAMAMRAQLALPNLKLLTPERTTSSSPCTGPR